MGGSVLRPVIPLQDGDRPASDSKEAKKVSRGNIILTLIDTIWSGRVVSVVARHKILHHFFTPVPAALTAWSRLEGFDIDFRSERDDAIRIDLRVRIVVMLLYVYVSDT